MFGESKYIELMSLSLNCLLANQTIGCHLMCKLSFPECHYDVLHVIIKSNGSNMARQLMILLLWLNMSYI